MYLTRRIREIFHQKAVLRQRAWQENPVVGVADLRPGRQARRCAVNFDDHFTDETQLPALCIVWNRTQLRVRGSRAGERSDGRNRKRQDNRQEVCASHRNLWW